VASRWVSRYWLMRTGEMPRTAVPTIAINLAQRSAAPNFGSYLDALPVWSGHRHSTDGKISP